MTEEERKNAIEIFIKRAKCRATSIDNIIEGIGIKCGETACEECPLYYDDDELHEAERIALEALKQEPCEDAISRQAVLELIDGYGVRMDGNNEFEYLCDGLVKGTKIAVCDAIKKLSSVTPTREHGEWIRVDDTKVKCSKCEITHFIAQYPHGKIDFCPNCGADMRGEWTDEVIEKQGNKLIECMTTEACKIAKGNIDKARKIMAGKISEEEEKQLIFGADMRKEQNNV